MTAHVPREKSSMDCFGFWGGTKAKKAVLQVGYGSFDLSAATDRNKDLVPSHRKTGSLRNSD
jgi:hypothetical protein